MRLAFLGTPEAAVPPLRGLVAAGHEVALVVSRPDKRRGRGSDLLPSPVKAAALQLGLAVTESVDDLLAVDVELGVVVAYGRILKPPVLGQVPLVNLHFSLLPRWRGAAPVERAILAGDRTTGVCLMDVEAGLDTGGVYGRVETAIGAEESAEQLRARLSELGTTLLIEQLAAGLGAPEPQRGEPTYAAKIEPEERRIDWKAAAPDVVRQVRIGRAWTVLEGKRLLVLAALAVPSWGPGEPGRLEGTSVTTGRGAVRLLQVQPQGKPPLDAAAWARGARLGPDTRFDL